MDRLDQHHLIDAVMAAESPEDTEQRNQQIAQLRALGYRLRWEPLYDARGFSVAKRIGLFARHEGEKPRLIEERFYWRGRIEGTPWSPMTKAQALQYTNRDGKIMAGW